MRYFLLILLCTGIVFSCSTTRTASDIAEESMNLEKFLMQQSGYVKVPITKMPSGHLHINGTVNGIKGNFILDTGAGATVIDNKQVEKFGLTLEVTDASGAGAGGQTTLQLAPANDVTFGDLKKSDFDLYVMSIDHVNNAFEAMGLEKVDGVIGADILTSNEGIIDYANLTLYLKK